MNNAECRSCGSRALEIMLDLAEQPLANNLLSDLSQSSNEPYFPLNLEVCKNCWLMQIKESIHPVELFSDYIYFSSFSDKMLTHSAEASENYTNQFELDENSFVVEIASNDGYLLKNFVKKKIPVLGIEPAANIAKVAEREGVQTLTEFFTEKIAKKLASEGKTADLILGNNVFAHAPDTNDFVSGLRILLKEKGYIILEVPYGIDFLEKNEFDTIYHEHIFYFTLTSLKSLFDRHKLEIIRVETHDIHGGTLRFFATHKGQHPIEDSVDLMIKREEEKGVKKINYYKKFRRRAEGIKADLLTLLESLKAKGANIAAYGASAKGSTLLNYVRPREGLIDYIVDRSTYKQGKWSPGLHLPIYSDEELAKRNPDYTLLLTWNFEEEILKQQAQYRKQGGKFIIPIPNVKIV